MTDTVDPIAAIFETIPDQDQGLVANQGFKIENYTWTQDMPTAVVKGTCYGNDGYVMPFLAIRVLMTVVLPTGTEQGIATIAVFRWNNEWVNTLNIGNRPTFSLEQYSKPIPERLRTLLSGGILTINNCTMMVR